MSWDYERSRERIKKHLDNMGEITVEKLVRDADLYSLLSETNCREIFGAHVYIDVPNFHKIASQVDGDDYRRVIQAVHLYQREVARIVESDSAFDGIRIHFQGPKLHALFYRPIDDAETLAAKAFLLQAVMRDFVRNIFNPRFPSLSNLVISGGADIGDAIGTQDGMRGDRELLFIGAPANYAAKIVADSARLRITARVFANLSEEMQELCSKLADGNYEIGAFDRATLQDLLQTINADWDPEKSAGRLDDDKKTFPLKSIEYSSADTLIDLDSLGITNNKRVLAASLFADVDGFTRYIDTAEKKSALRVLHAVRKEMSAVVRHDFDGLRIQYQGDRVQSLVHLPKDDGGAILEEAIKLAIGLQSSMEITLKECIPELASLRLAIGIDHGATLVSKLGTRGQRDRICIGLGVEHAAASQEKSSGGEISITPASYKLLSEESQENFNYDADRQLYVAMDLTTEKAERQQKARMYASGSRVFVDASSAGITISKTEGFSARAVVPSKSYAD